MEGRKVTRYSRVSMAQYGEATLLFSMRFSRMTGYVPVLARWYAGGGCPRYLKLGGVGFFTYNLSVGWLFLFLLFARPAPTHSIQLLPTRFLLRAVISHIYT